MRKVSIVLLLVAMLFVLIACGQVEENSGGNVGDTTIPHDEVDKLPEENGESENKEDDEIENEGGNADETEKPEEVKPPQEYDSIAIVTAQNVNIRSRASSKSNVLGTMKKGEGVMVVSRENSSWLRVHYKGKHAYISSSYVTLVSIPRSHDNRIEEVIREGAKLMGFPYVWGSQRYHYGNGVFNHRFKYGEFDCSALTQYIMMKGAGVSIGVTTRHQVMEGYRVTGDIMRGDLMFFTNASRRHKKGVEKVGHVAMYLGNNYILHTATGYAVIEEISHSRWNNYLVSKRYIH